MAFNIRKKRTTAPETSTDVVENKNATNVVATQSWVKTKLSEILYWAYEFKTNALQVLGPIASKSVETEDIITDKITTGRIVLMDSNGKPMILSIGDDGKLSTQYDYEKIYMYPGSGNIEITQFVYGEQNVPSNFIGLTPYQILDKFIPLSKTHATQENDKVCPMICDADGSHNLLPGTFLVSCNETCKISGISICDTNLNKIKEIKIPGGDSVRQLTINLPVMFYPGESTPVYIPIPAVVGQLDDCCVLPPPPGFKPPHPFHIPPVLNPFPLNASLFEDDKSQFEMDDVYDSELDSSSCGIGIDSTTSDLNESDNDIRIEYHDYATSTYANVILNVDEFSTNKRQFLVFDIKEV